MESGAQRRVMEWSWLSLLVSDSVESTRVDGVSMGASIDRVDAQKVGCEALHN